VITMKTVGRVPKAARQNKELRKAWKAALREEKDDIRAAYRKTYDNWDHKPREQTTVKASAGEMYAQVRLIGREYWFVHESISVLRAVFSDDWQPKTQPRVLGSGSGSGRMVYASKQIAKPPYEAREFTEAIIEERQGPFQKRMEQATAAGAKAALSGG